MKSNVRAFIGRPFTEAMIDRIEFCSQTRTRIQKLLDFVSILSIPIFSSHTAEKWGLEPEQPKILLERDLAELETCTHLITYFGDVHSFGSLVEVGYAVQLGRPILVVYESSSRPKSDFYEGLLKTGRMEELEWKDDANVASEVQRFLQR